jgi:hypothetical protein
MHEYTSSIFIKSPNPHLPQFYIDSLTVAELKRCFGENGEWGYAKAYVFNRSTNQFMSLNTFTQQSDAIVTGNWSTVSQYITEFPVWQAGESYGLGSCVTFTDSFNSTNFWIGVAPSTPGQSPETHPGNWYNLSAATTMSVIHQEFLYRLDTRVPEGVATRDFTLNVNSQVSNNGSRTPQIEVYADFNETVSGQQSWQKVYTKIVTYTESGTVKVKVTFSGDLSEIYYDNLTASQKNIKIILS